MQQENLPQTLSIVGSEVVAILSQEVKNREEKNQTNYSNEDSPEKKSGESSGSRGGASSRTLDASDLSGTMESPRTSSTKSPTPWQAASISLKDRSDSKDSQQKVEAAQSKQGLKSHWPSVEQTSLPPSAHLAGAFKRKKVDEAHETPTPQEFNRLFNQTKALVAAIEQKGVAGNESADERTRQRNKKSHKRAKKNAQKAARGPFSPADMGQQGGSGDPAASVDPFALEDTDESSGDSVPKSRTVHNSTPRLPHGSKGHPSTPGGLSVKAGGAGAGGGTLPPHWKTPTNFGGRGAAGGGILVPHSGGRGGSNAGGSGRGDGAGRGTGAGAGRALTAAQAGARSLVVFEEGEEKDDCMAAITRCVDMEGTFDESNLVLMGGFPADFTKVQAMEEIQFVVKYEGWVLDGDALDLQLGKSSWKLLQFNGLSGSFALVIQLEKAIRASVTPSWAKREYGLVNSRTGQLKQGVGSNWAHIYAIQVLPAGFDVSLLSDPTVAFFARMPMEYDAVPSSALYEFRRMLAERSPAQRKRYLSIVIRTIHPVPYYVKNARGELVGSARSKSIGQMIVAQLVFGTSTEPMVSSLRTLFDVPRPGTSVTHASFHSSGLTFEVFPDLWRLRPSALYPLDSPSLVAVPALLVSGFAEDLMPTTILQRLCFSNLINDEKVLDVIVLRRAKSKELLRLGYPQVDSLLLIGEGIRSSEPHLAAGETITLIDSAIPGLSKFRDHNADYVAFTDKKAGRAPALVFLCPW